MKAPLKYTLFVLVAVVSLIVVLSCWSFRLVASPGSILRVVDDGGKPLAGLHVIRRWDTSEGQKGEDQAITDIKGEVRFERVAFRMSDVPIGVFESLQEYRHRNYRTHDSAELLGELRLEPRAAIPTLTAALDREEYYVRIAAARALAEYGEQSRPAVPKLLSTMRDVEPRAKPYIAEAIRQIAPEVLTNAPAQ